LNRFALGILWIPQRGFMNRQAKAAVRFDCDCGHRLRVSPVQAISTSQLRGAVEDERPAATPYRLEVSKEGLAECAQPGIVAEVK
jgi:hypothetical protein